jgi:hypothetical protein
MKKSRQRLLSSVAAGLALLALLSWRLPCLVVTGADGRPLLRFPLWPEKQFTLTYVHSVQKTPCYENIELGPDGDLVLTSTEYESLGVGLPFSAGEGKLVNRDGHFILTGLNRHFAEIDLRAVPVARQALIVRGHRFDLNNTFAPGTLIRLKVRPVTLFQIFREKLCKGED